MVVAYLIVGMVFGALLAGTALIAGSSLWSAFLLYSLGGFLATLGLAILVYALPRKSDASVGSIGSPAPESTNA